MCVAHLKCRPHFEMLPTEIILIASHTNRHRHTHIERERDDYDYYCHELEYNTVY